jgi:hypothetical protein
MSTRNVLAGLTALAIGLALIGAIPATAGPVPLPGTQAVSVRMIEAVKARSYQDFLTDADAQLKSQVDRTQFEEICSRYAEPLLKGYRLVYMDHLRRRGTLVLLWKLTLGDSQDEALLRIVMRDGKVEDFSVL